jgi:hypothetical protein
VSRRQADHPPAGCQRKSGIFLGKWHKKVAGRRGKHFELVTSITVQAAGSSAKIRVSLSRLPAISYFFHGSRK